MPLGNLRSAPLDEPFKPKSPWLQLSLQTDHNTIQEVCVCRYEEGKSHWVLEVSTQTSGKTL